MQTPVCSFATKPLGHFFCYWANVYGLFCLSWGEGHGVYGLFNRTIACVKISTGHVIKFSKAQFFKKARGPMASFFFAFLWSGTLVDQKKIWNASFFSNSTHEMILKLSNFIVSFLFRLFTQLWAVVSCSFADTHIIIGPYIGLYLFRNLIFRRTKSDLKVVKKLSTKKK